MSRLSGSFFRHRSTPVTCIYIQVMFLHFMVLNPHVWWFRWGFTIILSIISIFNGFFIPQKLLDAEFLSASKVQYVLMQTVKPSLQLLNPFMSKDGSIMFNPDRFNSDFILIQHWIGGRANHVWWLNRYFPLFESQLLMVKLNSMFDGEIRTSGLPDLREAAPRSRGGTEGGEHWKVRQFTQIVNMN